MKKLFLTLLSSIILYYLITLVFHDIHPQLNQLIIVALIFLSYFTIEFLPKWNKPKDLGNVVFLDEFRKKKQKKLKQKKKQQRKKQKEEQQISWKIVYRSPEQAKIELMNSLLNNHQIPSYIGNRHTASMLPGIDTLNYQLLVKPEDEQKALQILNQHNFDVPKA